MRTGGLRVGWEEVSGSKSAIPGTESHCGPTPATNFLCGPLTSHSSLLGLSFLICQIMRLEGVTTEDPESPETVGKS